MSVKNELQDQVPALDATTESLSCTSILTWIHKLHTPPSYSSSPSSSPSLSIPALPEETPTRVCKRTRSLTSTPSEFLGDGPAFRKRRKLQELGVDMAGDNPDYLPTPSAEVSSLGQSVTPSKSAQSINSPGADPHTPSSKKPETSKSTSTNTKPGLLDFKLTCYGLMQDDEAYEKAPSFKSNIEGIIISERGSSMGPASIKRCRETHNVFKWMNETSYLFNMLPLLQGNGYEVEAQPSEGSDQQEAESLWAEFVSDEKLARQLNQDFARTILPGRFADDQVLMKILNKKLAKYDGMTNPRPDVTFGLQRNKHPFATGQQPPQHIIDLLEIVPNVHHPFLIVEGKSHAGDSAIAETQARRGGAVLVKASRTLRTILETYMPNPPDDDITEPAEGTMTPDNPSMPIQRQPVKPDEKSFVFSATVSPSIFEIWVHWFDEGNRLYHMNSVDAFNMSSRKGPLDIRRALHNIIDFGVNKRAAQNRELVRLIEKYSREVTLAEIQTAADQVNAANAAKVAATGAEKRRRGD